MPETGGLLNHGFDYRERIPRTAAGKTVLAYLCARYDHSSAEEWRSRIAKQLVRLDGKTAQPDTPLRPGQTLIWHRPPWREPDIPRGFAVAFRDSDLLAVIKPAGTPTLPGAGFLENTLLAQVRDREPEAVPMHRLGRWTSGLVLFARNGAARATLAESFRTRRIEKQYRCVAAGIPTRRRFQIDVPIGLVPYPPLGLLWAANPEGKPARTVVDARRVGRDAFLADVRIVTGRPHQIRIHLAAAGHPLVGDPLYAAGGRPREGSRALPGDPGYLLHATRLRLPHPRTGHELDLRSAPPFDLDASTEDS